ncbi:ATP-binding protein [Reichenbachiella faecimaris]|nr:ATP-binding protein [Reichenbachiella faecimaris]
MAMLIYAMAYRLYLEEYWTTVGYGLGWIFTYVIWRVSRQAQSLRLIVVPWAVFIFLFAIFFWFKTGGLNGSGLVFFSVSLTLVIIASRKWRIRLIPIFIITQSLLVWADIYLKHLPIWGVNDKPEIDFVLLTSIVISLVVMLKNNYDDKEEKIEKFSRGLRELHRLNLKHDSNLDEVLTDYLNSGTELLGMQTGVIVDMSSGTSIIRNISNEQYAAEQLSLNEGVLRKVYEEDTTLFRAGSSSNLDNKKISGIASKYFIASPLMVNNAKYGVLLFAAEESKRNRFEEYDIEIVELMAINISHLLDIKVWSEHQKKTDYELHLSEKRFKTIYDYANVGICVCDRKGMILMVNRALQELLEYTEAELIGETFYSISDSGDLDEMDLDIRQYEKIVVGEIDHYVIEKKNTTKSGKEIIINKTVSTVRDENEKVRFTVMIVDDVTNRKLNETKISNLNQQLEVQVEKMDVANKELEAFSYSVSHDLRAPLRAIDGFSKIILEDHEDEFNEESKRLLNVIIKNSGKMAMLIDDLLTFSRITRKITEFKPINFEELVLGIIEEQALDESSFAIGTLPEAKGEPTLMKQVLSNLIGNAVKFSAKEEKPEITIGVHEMDDHYEFFVKDNGVGFNMAYYDKIFGVFQRLHTEEEFKGTGVGLAIVQKVMMKHNGKVWAESEEGVGTTFYFSLPK